MGRIECLGRSPCRGQFDNGRFLIGQKARRLGLIQKHHKTLHILWHRARLTNSLRSHNCFTTRKLQIKASNFPHIVKAVSVEREQKEQIAEKESQSLRVQFQSGKIFAAGCRPMLEDVNPEVFLCRSNDKALILGVESSNGESSMHDIALAKLVCKQFLACARCKLWWMTPEWGQHGHQIPPETQFLLLELGEGGPYGILLPLIDSNTFRATLRPHKTLPGDTVIHTVSAKIEKQIKHPRLGFKTVTRLVKPTKLLISVLKKLEKGTQAQN